MATTSTLPAADQDDWLGYGAYADALWSRVVRALEKDKGGKLLGDDPLVIGIFGEWGAGKSQLLKLLNKKAQGELAGQIAARASDPGFSLTVPVWFQPWKYEHEAHLHVPMIIHVLNALKDALKQDPTVVQSLVEAGSQAVALAERAAPVVAATAKVAKVANAIFPVVQKIFRSVSVLGVSIDLPDEIQEWLEIAASGETGGKKEEKSERGAPGGAVQKRTSGLDHSVRHVEDGTYFYRIHELLQELTRPGTFKDKKTLLENADLTPNTRINFVIFIDDLDRCLPEKAVQTLELIKTIFNAESFAFVLALDDEVIERGIGHRYKDYELLNKKPSMPITGFEYLEKIVHLPFKLPALTSTQARGFVQRLERQIAGEDIAHHWFQRIDDRNPQAKFQRTDLHGAGSDVEPFQFARMRGSGTWELEVFDLMALALAGFDAFVPRKLSRMVELWHATVQVAQLRNTEDGKKEALAPSTAAQVDVRLAFSLMLIQLFHPDLYRVLRRHEETFRTLYDGFDGTGENLSPSKSDIDLWHWVAYRSPTDRRPTSFDETLALIAGLDDSTRYPAQQKRLPLVECIVAHRKVQRHVFDALKLLGALKQQMPELPTGFAIGQYFSMLAQYDETLTPPRVSVKETANEADAVSPGRFTPIDPQQLYLSLIAADEGTQEGIAKNALLEEGKFLAKEAVSQLADRVGKWLGEVADTAPERSQRRLQILRGLGYLAPYLAASDAKSLWALAKDSVDFTKNVEPKTRALWGDVRSLLGCEDRFDLARPYMFKSRCNGHTEEDEPIPGFVRIPAGEFQIGSQEDKDNPPRQVPIKSPFYINRTLVTVQQYARFIKAGGYKDDNAWWDKQGVAWRNGSFDSQVNDEDHQKWLKQRSIDLRQQPMHWVDQEKLTSRPVWGVNWFEARAYARWLNAEMRQSITGASIGRAYKIRLPTELQWERAARAKSLTEADTRRWPWGDNEKLADQQANLNQTVGSVSAVGLYPPSPIGLCDMAGNAWEWMDNLYQSKPAKMVGVKKDVDLISGETVNKSDTPTLRGGSWLDHPDDARCSSRYWGHPDYAGTITGFRVVLSLAD